MMLCVCSALAGACDIPTPTCTSLLVHIYIGIHSTFFGRISMRTDRERIAGAKRTVEKDLGCIGEAGAPFSNYGGRGQFVLAGADLSH